MHSNVLSLMVERITNLRGVRASLAAALFGALAALALPPVNFLPILLISFPGLVLLLDGAKSARRAFLLGWCWGFGHFTAGLYWIAHALLTDPARFGWMIPFAVFGLAALLGVFIALATLAARLAAPENQALRLIALGAAWGMGEWLRGVVLTGFPWNLTATMWLEFLPVAQFASVFGGGGLAFVTVFAAGSVALLANPGWKNGAVALFAWGLLAGIALWGANRIPDGPAPVQEGVLLRLVQGNVEQKNKWREDIRQQHLTDYVLLSTSPGWEKISAVVWPETAVPFFIDGDYPARVQVAAAAPPDGFALIGSLRIAPLGGPPKQLWNSLMAVNRNAEIVAVYDKAHLVPFGEYVPFENILPLAKMVFGPLGFSTGDGLKTVRLPGLPSFSPTICYEEIFPDAVARRDDRPDWLLNVTNDAWFGESAGPYQHFAAARLRAIEEGLPMVRAANTGVSGIIDPYGRILGALSLGERGILDGPLPLPLEATIFTRFGGILSSSLLATLFFGIFFVSRRRKKRYTVL